MSEFDLDERTQPASPRRRAEARASGSVPRSPDVAATLVLVMFTCGLVLIGPSLLTAGKQYLSSSLAAARPDVAHSDLLEPAGVVVRIAVNWLLLAVACAIIGNVVQFGLLFAPRVIQPDPARLSLERGLQRMAAEIHPRALLLSLARLISTGAITVWFIWSLWPGLVRPEPGTIGDSLADAVILLGCGLTASAALISALRAITERMRHEARLRMTPREAREEQRMNEADPAVVQRRHDEQQRRVRSIAGNDHG